MEEIDRKKQQEGSELIERGLELMREADPGCAPGVVVGWTICFGTAAIEEGEDYSGVHIMLPPPGLSWPLLIGILRGASLKAERRWLKAMEGHD